MFQTISDTLAPKLGDNHEYPRRWSEYVGQEPAKHMLQIAVKSAKARKAPLDHILIAHGTGGIGKTALANLVGNAMGGEVRVASGTIDAMQARMILAEMSDNDVLFIDEAHQLVVGGRTRAEWLLNYLQDGCLPGPFGLEQMPRVTIVAATTDAGKLPETIVGRFPIQPPMQDYSLEEATKVCVTMSKRILGDHGLAPLKKAAAERVARAASHNPRAIRRLLVVLRDLVLAGEMRGDAYDIGALLAYQGVTEDGLDRTAQQYLQCLAFEFQGKAGAKALEDRLQQPGGLHVTERLLMDKRLITKSRSGREITTDGIRRLTALMKEQEEAAA